MLCEEVAGTDAVWRAYATLSDMTAIETIAML
jgi:hypothetical protein